MKLHGAPGSSAAYRVRAVLHLKGIAFEEVMLDLGAGDQASERYRALNPQGLVPALETDEGEVLTQSLAICEYLEQLVPDPPLLPADVARRAKVRAVMLAVACEIHPLQNRRTLVKLRSLGLDKEAVDDWTQDFIGNGLDAVETMVVDEPGPFCFGDAPTLADVFVIPQLRNARRFKVAARWPRLQQAEAACFAHPAFAFGRARPPEP
jgi:maleylpyruvate isomerase